MNPLALVLAMLSSAQRRTSRRPSRLAIQTRTVCVVDPQPRDYEAWRSTADTHGLRLEFCPTAETALRLARQKQVDLWVVNTDLPGRSGYELCEMLKARSKSTAVYLVANQYTPAAEQAAWRARATLFACKAACQELLRHWLGRDTHKSCHAPPAT